MGEVLPGVPLALTQGKCDSFTFWTPPTMENATVPRFGRLRPWKLRQFHVLGVPVVVVVVVVIVLIMPID